MYKEFSVNNFRGFEKFTIGLLERVNLIAGKNNVGKTALLEAFWFHHGAPDPGLAIRLNRFRGIVEINASYPCLEVFNNLDIEKRIEFASISEDGTKQDEVIYTREPSLMSISDGKYSGEERQASLSLEGVSKEIVIDWVNGKGKKGQAVAYFTPTGVKFDTKDAPKRATGRLLVSRRGLTPDDIEGFGQLEIKGKREEILELLKLVEPRLKSLTTVVRGGVPSIWGDIGVGTLLPIQLMGDGLSRWLIFVLAILRSENGLVLVDEIENGIHHSIMFEIWKNLALLARRYNVQIIATTHSEECVRIAHKSFVEGEKYDFKLHRLDMVDGKVEVKNYEKDVLSIAIESGLEYR